MISDTRVNCVSSLSSEASILLLARLAAKLGSNVTDICVDASRFTGGAGVVTATMRGGLGGARQGRLWVNHQQNTNHAPQ